MKIFFFLGCSSPQFTVSVLLPRCSVYLHCLHSTKQRRTEWKLTWWNFKFSPTIIMFECEWKQKIFIIQQLSSEVEWKCSHFSTFIASNLLKLSPWEHFWVKNVDYTEIRWIIPTIFRFTSSWKLFSILHLRESFPLACVILVSIVRQATVSSAVRTKPRN